MKFSKLVGRISGDGADAWKTHYHASRARGRGEDVILLSVGDPDLDTPAPVVDRAIESLDHRLAMTPRVQLDAVVLKPNVLG